jgi:hypothetical protein
MMPSYILDHEIAIAPGVGGQSVDDLDLGPDTFPMDQSVSTKMCIACSGRRPDQAPVWDVSCFTSWYQNSAASW